MAFLLAGEHHRSFLYLVPTLQTAPLLGLTRTTDCRRRSLLRTSALRPEMTALREMARLLADVCNYCEVVVAGPANSFEVWSSTSGLGFD